MQKEEGRKERGEEKWKTKMLDAARGSKKRRKQGNQKKEDGRKRKNKQAETNTKYE